MQSEKVFHDLWALSIDPRQLDVRAEFDAPAALENAFILREMGDLRGKRLLDLGCGVGASSVFFALQGAEVTAVDLSPEMIRRTEDLATLNGVRVRTVVGAAESLDLPPGQFDFVYLGNLSHHIEDRERLWSRILSLLKPGGTFFAWDPLAYNPAINIYRRLATEVRTRGETPLRRHDVALIRRFFPALRKRHFWIASLVLFLKYFFVDQVHPNAERYWKRILKESPKDLSWLRPFLWLDLVLTRCPGLCWWSWNVVLWGCKPITNPERI